MSKPQYRVPTMAEVREVPKNGFKAVSTFSGCGGSSLGYRMAGFDVLWANEFVDAARECYIANASSHTIVDGRDIRKVEPREILDAIKLGVGEIDLFDGSPPCASFSTAGKREAGWGKVKKYSDKLQRTDDLFFEFARLISGTKPKVFVAENVSGLIKGTAKGYFVEILAALKACGYRVRCKVLDAQWLGVPQSRQRTIFIGVREDLDIEPVYPSPLPYRYTIRDAINNTSMIVEKEADISRYCTGREWDKLKQGEQSKKYFNLVRTHINKPVPTICSSHGSSSIASVTHPFEKRKFAIAELKRLCGFPDDFNLTGTYAQKWERLGRAVPPVMMRRIAEEIRDKILTRVR